MILCQRACADCVGACMEGSEISKGKKRRKRGSVGIDHVALLMRKIWNGCNSRYVELTSINESMPVSSGFTLISVRLNGCIVCEVRRDKELEEALGVHYFVYNSQRWVQR